MEEYHEVIELRIGAEVCDGVETQSSASLSDDLFKHGRRLGRRSHLEAGELMPQLMNIYIYIC